MATAEFILGTDGDTPASIRELYEFATRTKIAIARFYILTPIPGTDLYKQYKEEGRLLHEDYQYYTSTHCVYQPAKMTPANILTILSHLLTGLLMAAAYFIAA